MSKRAREPVDELVEPPVEQPADEPPLGYTLKRVVPSRPHKEGRWALVDEIPLGGAGQLEVSFQKQSNTWIGTPWPNQGRIQVLMWIQGDRPDGIWMGRQRGKKQTWTSCKYDEFVVPNFGADDGIFLKSCRKHPGRPMYATSEGINYSLIETRDQ